MRISYTIRKSIIITFSLLLIFLYFIFLVNSYIIPNDYKISIPLFLGFAIIIIVIFHFFLKINSHNSTLLQFNFLDENSIKTILIILMAIMIFIPPVSFSELIVAWDQISILNYIRGIVFIIGSLFIPGASIFNLILSKCKIHETLKIEYFLVKITLYPIISLTYLGTLTLILDFSGFTKNTILLISFFSLIFLFLLDIIFQRIKGKKFKIQIIRITISRYTTLIIIVGLSIIIIASGFLLSKPYLLAGDRWRGIYSAPLIGLSDAGPFERLIITESSQYYTYWGYIIFSLSKLSGIPFINTNVLLYPFLFISITSIYLLIKALLNKLRSTFHVLSSIFIVVWFNPTMLIMEFSFHSFAFLSLFLSLTLFKIVINSENLDKSTKINKENKILLVLSSLFLIQSLMLYFLTALIGLIIIFLFCIFSINIKHSFRYLMYFYISVIIIFICFDIISFNFFSYKCISIFLEFLVLPQTKSYLIQRFLYSFLFYYILFGSLILVFFINLYSSQLSRLFKKMKKKVNLLIIKKSIINYFFSIMFVFFLICILIANLDSTFKERLILRGRGEQNLQVYFLIFYLSNLIGYIGIFGILGIFLSHFCFKENKRLFFFLFLWIILTLGLASSLIILRWIQYPTSLVSNIPENLYRKLIHWFTRNWYYSIIPLSIFLSIGLIKLVQNVKPLGSHNTNSHIWFKMKTFNRAKIITSISLILIIFSLSSPITQLQYWDNYSSVSDDHAQIIGWTYENVPKDSKILIYPSDYHLTRLENDLFLYKTYYLNELIISMNNISELIEYLDSEAINYFIIDKIYVGTYQELLDSFYRIILFQFGNLIIYSSIEI